MKKTYYPKGVCSRKYDIEIENGIITGIAIEGGCNGNLKGISALLMGRNAAEAAALMKGIRCGMRPTSCPDQISRALEEMLQEEEA